MQCVHRRLSQHVSCHTQPQWPRWSRSNGHASLPGSSHNLPLSTVKDSWFNSYLLVFRRKKKKEYLYKKNKKKAINKKWATERRSESSGSSRVSLGTRWTPYSKSQSEQQEHTGFFYHFRTQTTGMKTSNMQWELPACTQGRETMSTGYNKLQSGFASSKGVQWSAIITANCLDWHGNRFLQSMHSSLLLRDDSLSVSTDTSPFTLSSCLPSDLCTFLQ